MADDGGGWDGGIGKPAQVALPTDVTGPFTPFDRPTAEPGPDGWQPRGGSPDLAFPVPWRWWDALIAFLLSFFLSVPGAAAVFLVVPMSAQEGALILVSSALLFLAPVVWIGLRFPHALRRLLGPVRARLSHVLIGLVHGALAFVTINLVITLLIELIAEQAGLQVPQVQEELQDAVRDPDAALLVTLSVAVLAPLGEEVLFRGVLFQALRTRIRLWPATVVSGVVFGASHVEPLAIVLTAILGFYLAWIFHRTGSLLVPILAHATFNALSLILITLSPPV